MEAVEVKKALNLVPELLDVPYSRIWVVYDKEADVRTSISKSQAMRTIQSLRMMIS